MKIDRNYYIKNTKYSKFLETQSVNDFKVYIDTIITFSKNGKKILDLGCGTGIVVDYLAQHGFSAYGIEIANSSLKIARKKKGRYFLYDGKSVPFSNSSFDIVGSFNVVEHVPNVREFLQEQLRVLKIGGYLIVCAPNFLSITNSFHYRTRGVGRKCKNILIVIKKTLLYFFNGSLKFGTMRPLFRKDFHPDDDAINVINPTDLLKWGREKQLRLILFRGTSMPSAGIKKHLSSIPFIRVFFGSILIVFQKL